MPFVNVKMLKGRTREQKRELAQSITDALERICGARRETTMVVVEEVERENWAVGGVMVADRQ